jgi:hypothetical protein
MTKRVADYNGGSCHEIVEKCEAAARSSCMRRRKYSSVYPDPASKWSMGGCRTATHIKKAVAEQAQQKINPLEGLERAPPRKVNPRSQRAGR